MDLASLDRATDYVALAAAMWPEHEQRISEGHIWMTDPRDPDERTDRFAINCDNGMATNHATGENTNMLSLVKQTTGDWKLWAATCPEAAPLLPGKKKRTGGLGLKTKRHPGAAEPATDAAPERTYAEELQEYAKKHTEEWAAPFAEAWGVPAEVVREWGSCYAATRGRTAGKPVWNVGMRNTAGAVVGIKSRALEPIWKSGGKARKTTNRGKTGLVGWPSSVEEGDERPFLFVEGEKDFIVARHHLSEWFIVVGTLGGASSFKDEWAEAVRASKRAAYWCYDNDDNEAGWTGALKACRKCWDDQDSDVRIAHLPELGQDVFDFLRGKEDVCEPGTPEALRDIILDAERYEPNTQAEAKAVINAHLDDEELRKDDVSMSRALYSQLLDHGGRFYHDGDKAYLLWQKAVFTVDGRDTGWAVLQGDLTGMSPYRPMGGAVTRGVRALALQRGARMEASAWQATRPGKLYLPLYNAASDLVRITEDTMEVVPNGTDDVVLLPDRDTKPIEFLPDVEYDAEKAQLLWDKAFGNLNLTPAWRHFVSAFGLSFPFYNYSQTHPHLRFQGPAGSGKSTAFVFLNAIISGNAVPVGGLTMAGMWRLAAKVPVVALDDLEAAQVRREPYLKEFFLRAAVGGQRVMAGEEMGETVRQTVGCHLISNGISPITANTPALAERIIVVPMLPKEQHNVGFYAKGIVDALLENRDLLWNHIFRHAQGMLKMLNAGAIQNLMRQFPPDKRQRLHEFFALLSVTLGYAETPAPFVDEWLVETTTQEDEAKAEGSGLVTMMLNLPAYLDAPDEQMAPGAKAMRGINTHTDGNLWKISQPVHVLHTLFTRMRKDMGLAYASGSAQELGNDIAALGEVGEDFGLYLKRSRPRIGGTQHRGWEIGVSLDAAAPIGKPKPTLQEEETA